MGHQLKCKTINLLGEKREKILELGVSKEFLDLTPKAWSIKGKIGKLDLVNIKKKTFALERPY